MKKPVSGKTRGLLDPARELNFLSGGAKSPRLPRAGASGEKPVTVSEILKETKGIAFGRPSTSALKTTSSSPLSSLFGGFGDLLGGPAKLASELVGALGEKTTQQAPLDLFQLPGSRSVTASFGSGSVVTTTEVTPADPKVAAFTAKQQAQVVQIVRSNLLTSGAITDVLGEF